MKRNTITKIISLLGLALFNTSCVMNASISDLGSRASSNLSNTDAAPTVKMDKISVDLTQVTLTEGSVAVINVAVNPVRTVDTVINLSLNSSSSAIRFNPIPAQITIPAGMTSKSVILNTIDDTLVQNQEIWYFTITPVDTNLQADPGQLVITLNDNDGGYIPNSGPAVSVPTLLKEFNLMPSNLSGIEYKGKLIYAGSDAANGTELWISDGTTLGTYLVKDISPGFSSSSPTSFYKDANSNYVYFVAKTQSEGKELWRTDGTANGTILLKDIEPGVADSNPAFTYTQGNTVFFTATNSANGNELYITDGSISGTQILKELEPGPDGIGGISNFVYFNSYIYFSVESTVTYTYQLWKTDGTTAGTSFVLSNNSTGSTFQTVNFLKPLNGKLLFTAYVFGTGYELYSSDGISSSNTAIVKDINSGSSSSNAQATDYVVNSKSVLFVPYDADPSGGIWFTDGTTAGTTKMLVTPTVSSLFGVVNSKLVFAGTASSDNEIWASDGTVGGTVLLKDIYPGSTGSSPTFLAATATKIFFTANSSAEGTELWVTDGTPAGTILLADIYPGTNSSNITNAQLIGSRLVFRASNPSFGSELWVSDGTIAGTGLLKDINPGSKSSGPTKPIFIDNNHFFFAAYNTTTQFPTLFFSDFTTNGTYGINHAILESGDSRTVSFTQFNSLVYFDAMDDTTGNPLWVTDGTTAGTSKIKDLNPNITCSDFSKIHTFNGSLFFSATTSANGKEIIVSDGTTSGTQILKDIYSGSSNGIFSLAPVYTTSSNKFFFPAMDSSTGTELWISDLTIAGTSMVKDLYAGSGSTSPSNIYLVPGTNEVLFCGNKSDSKSYLFRSDGTSAGTQEVVGLGSIGCVFSTFYPAGNNIIIIKSTETSSYKDRLHSYNSVSKTLTLLTPNFTTDIMPTSTSAYYYNPRLNLTFFATASSPYNTLKLWKTDGTAVGTVNYHSIPITSSSYSVGSFVDTGTKVLFTYSNISPTAIYELWQTDGTAAGTSKIKNLSGSITSGIVYGGKYIFVLNDGVNGAELWQTDGTSAGTSMIKDINPGSGSSSPSNFTLFAGKVYFAANDGSHGVELWRTDGTLIGTELVYDINPGDSSSSPTTLTPIGGKLYFKATKILSGQEVWIYSP